MGLDDWLSRLPRKDWQGWATAASFVVIAAIARTAFPLAGAFITFYPAVLFSALVAGPRAGLVALAVCAAITPVFIGSVGTIPTSLWGVVSWFTFIFFGLAIIAAIDFQQRTLTKARLLAEELGRQKHFTEAVIAAAPSLTYIFDLDNRSNVFLSPRVMEVLGYSPAEVAGLGSGLIERLLHPDDQQRMHEHLAGIKASDGAGLFETEYRIQRKDGRWAWLLSRDRVFMRGADGVPTQILGVATDITERKQAEERLQSSEERFRGIYENAPTGISISDMAGNFIQCNPAYEKILGYSEEELLGISFRTLVHPADREANFAEMQRLVRQEIPFFEIFNRSIHKDGRVVWVHKFVLLLFDRGGTPVNMVALVTDMTERKRYEEQIRLLMREVNHRSKNLLAVVQSVARQTANYGDPLTFAQRFGERLKGLSASHDLLVNNAWQGVDLGDLVRSQLAHFEDLVGSRISLSGPVVHINATAAQSLGMALHELATNAGKYGALSNKSGRVAIAWSLEGSGDSRRFIMTWSESGGPEVRPPERTGLGSLITTRLAEQSLDAHVNVTFEPHGLLWKLDAPAVRMMEAAEVAV